jgi:hypothetical protein
MKRFLLSSIFSLILSCLTFVASSQDITLSQANKSGIYVKGQKIAVKAFAENLSGGFLQTKGIVYQKLFKVIERFRVNSTACHVNVCRSIQEWVQNSRLPSDSDVFSPLPHSAQFLIRELKVGY